MKKILFLISTIFLLAACSSDDEVLLAPLVSGVEDAYTILEDAKLALNPNIENGENATILWYIDGDGVAKTESYIFQQSKAGEYNVELKVVNEGGVIEKTISITVGAKNIVIEGTAHTLIPVSLPDYMKEIENIKWGEITADTKLYRFSNNPVLAETPFFIAAVPGEYVMQANWGEVDGTVTFIIAESETTPSAYIAKIFDYFPAPGQFVNKMPKYEEGDSHDDMVAKAANALVGENTSMITLGGWGGYVTIGFDHTIVNVAGKKDFRIEGNAFGSNANPDDNAPFGGSCEPGIIMVSYDANGNGEPDDEWYEIKGSGNFTAENENWYQKAVDNGNDVNTYRDFEMTYYKPTDESTAPGEDYIRWTNNKGGEGYKEKNAFHRQSYYPLWKSEDKITFDGIRLAQNGVDESGQGSYFVLYAFKYGYVDNFPNRDDRAAIDIDWAIDKDGNKVNLPGINFVKIYNGVDQENGWLGEVSTEVSKGYNLHLLDMSIDTITEE